jgi:hypothetical protein
VNPRFTRERPYRLRVLWAGLTPWQLSASLLLFGWDSLPGLLLVRVCSSAFRVRPTSVSGFPRLWHTICFSCADAPFTRSTQEPPGSPKFLTFLSTHPTPCGPRQALRALTRFSALFVLASGPLTPSPPASFALTRLYQALGSAVFPTGYVVPCIRLNCFVRSCSHLLNDLPDNCNTRYGWMVSPSPAGTCTLQETPSSLGALTAQLTRRSLRDSLEFKFQVTSIASLPTLVVGK